LTDKRAGAGARRHREEGSVGVQLERDALLTGQPRHGGKSLAR
jgi:hypothetical protein